MRTAIIGRTEILYLTVELFLKNGYEIALISHQKKLQNIQKHQKILRN